MSNRAERKTPGKLLTNYSNNFSIQFHRILRVLYHLSVSEPDACRDSYPTTFSSNSEPSPARRSIGVTLVGPSKMMIFGLMASIMICLQTGYGKGIGSQAISKLRVVAAKANRTLWEIAKESDTFSELRRWRSHFERFVQSIEKIIAAANGLYSVAVVELVVMNLGTRSRVSAQRLQTLVT